MVGGGMGQVHLCVGSCSVEVLVAQMALQLDYGDGNTCHNFHNLCGDGKINYNLYSLF